MDKLKSLEERIQKIEDRVEYINNRYVELANEVRGRSFRAQSLSVRTFNAMSRLTKAVTEAIHSMEIK